MIDPDLLKKYELDGMFRKQGTHSFFLINIEPIIYLLTTSLITYGVLTLLKSRMLKGKNPLLLKEKDLSMIEK